MVELENIENLPLVMTADDIRKKLRDCSTDTIRRAWKDGKIVGKRISAKRVLFETASVLRWLGIGVPEARLAQWPKPRKKEVSKKVRREADGRLAK